MLWLKSFHLIFVVTWFAALFYMPRLFVYHSMATDAISTERFKTMERKLMRGIMNPSAVLALGFGLAMLIQGWDAYRTMGWLWTKLAIVAGLFVFHGYAIYIQRSLAADRSPHGHKFYRVFNELPVFVLIPGIILAVTKPF